MADMGWVRNDAAGRWELRDHRGECAGTVRYEVIEQMAREPAPAGYQYAQPVPGAELARGYARANRSFAGSTARAHWPPLHGVPATVLYLTGGPADGLWQYLQLPGDDDVPPDEFLVALELPLPLGLPPADMPPAEQALAPARYVRQPQPCGHGRACPWPYAPG